MITTEQIKELRDATSVSVMQCKKALEETGGDMEKALMVLKKKSVEMASKKSDREVKAGLIALKSDNKKAVAAVLQCETDFVAKNQDFVDLTNKIAQIAFENGKDKAEADAGELINNVIQKVGENIKIKEISIIEGENLGIYTHSGKLASIVSLKGGTPELAKDVAMQVAAMNPEFMSMTDIDDQTKENVRQLFVKEVEETNKPEEIKKKILDGKVASYFNERVLTEQAFIKDPNVSIGKLLANAGDAKIIKAVRISI
ncbi:MAG: Elongation factor Ts [Candidatus Nomurabacteria bacterium GW2011_GWB1_37_5]|uniref:Elongation factor Ts n=1 Tax=Candidatus Nomurabacteria bacterium GW2011_GWB1_37_5 TaxID=1618742 RepID=A0A0G0GXB4_9BACT|nr:MAG: Elongation factor Ts [Candidatus Nomurabacteria bacterium GW2011_GWB1_37_5]